MTRQTGSARLAYRVAKRSLDIACSGAGLVLLSPLLAVVALAVRFSSQGPTLFRQRRVGRDGRAFDILKFRSMRPDVGGPAVTASGDRRVTSLGRFLRGTKLDELPQLWNVLVGDMSLVGPRPEVPEFVARFPADYARILAVRPGITDFAALEYLDEEAVLASSAESGVHLRRTRAPRQDCLLPPVPGADVAPDDLGILMRTVAALLRGTS